MTRVGLPAQEPGAEAVGWRVPRRHQLQPPRRGGRPARLPPRPAGAPTPVQSIVEIEVRGKSLVKVAHVAELKASHSARNSEKILLRGKDGQLLTLSICVLEQLSSLAYREMNVQ